jgi:hypothetical protein
VNIYGCCIGYTNSDAAYKKKFMLFTDEAAYAVIPTKYM